MKTKRGFTLVEILIVIAVIAVLALIAIPKYYSLKDHEKFRIANNHANMLATASAINRDACTTNPDRKDCKSVNNCADLAKLLTTPLPRGMKVQQKPATVFPANPGEIAECQIIYGSIPVDFKAIAEPGK